MHSHEIQIINYILVICKLDNLMNKNEIEKSLFSIMNGDISANINNFEKLSIKKNITFNTQSFNKIKDYGKLE